MSTNISRAVVQTKSMPPTFLTSWSLVKATPSWGVGEGLVHKVLCDSYSPYWKVCILCFLYLTPHPSLPLYSLLMFNLLFCSLFPHFSPFNIYLISQLFSFLIQGRGIIFKLLSIFWVEKDIEYYYSYVETSLESLSSGQKQIRSNCRNNNYT